MSKDLANFLKVFTLGLIVGVILAIFFKLIAVAFIALVILIMGFVVFTNKENALSDHEKSRRL